MRASLAILMSFTLLHAQAPLPRPAFEVTSVKPTPPESQNRIRTEHCPAGGNFSVGGAPVLWSLTYAYHLKEYEISGAPAWLGDFASTYDMEGKPPGHVNDEQCRLMVQSLFADRFRLTTHFETREASVYLLTIGKSGPKLREGGGVRLNGSVQVGDTGKPDWPDGWTASELAAHLSDFTGRPVVDRTGLTGKYGITLDFSRTDGDERPSIFTAVQEQLGLRLDAGKAPIRMLVIDHIGKPGAN